MTLGCPQCSAPAAFAAESPRQTGTLLRCARCGTTWLARPLADDPFAAQPAFGRGRGGLSRGRPRFERVIDHVAPGFGKRTSAGPTPEPAARVHRPRRAPALARSHGLVAWSSAAAAVVVGALVAALAMFSSGVDASTVQGTGKFSGLEVRMLRGAVEAVRDGHAVAVEGEISNRSGRALDVPAVRVSLLAGGAEMYEWRIEPTTTRLAPGGSLQFRSVLAAPPGGIDEVAFRLADRHGLVVGMH